MHPGHLGEAASSRQQWGICGVTMADKRLRSFFSEDPAGQLYRAHLDHGTKTGVRERIEALWQRYRPYCPDRHFLSDAREHFVERTWEMYPACSALGKGHQAGEAATQGAGHPRDGRRRHAVDRGGRAGAGRGKDAVPGRDKRGHTDDGIWCGRPPSEEELVLRCTGALTAKPRKWSEYVVKGEGNCRRG